MTVLSLNVNLIRMGNMQQ